MSEMVPVTTVEQVDRLEAHVKDGGGLSKFGLLSLLANYREAIVARDAVAADFVSLALERDVEAAQLSEAIAERDAAQANYRELVLEREAEAKPKPRPAAARTRA